MAVTMLINTQGLSINGSRRSPTPSSVPSAHTPFPAESQESLDARLDVSAKALMETDPDLIELARSDWSGAYKQALRQAAPLIGWTASHPAAAGSTHGVDVQRLLDQQSEAQEHLDQQIDRKAKELVHSDAELTQLARSNPLGAWARALPRAATALALNEDQVSRARALAGRCGEHS